MAQSSYLFSRVFAYYKIMADWEEVKRLAADFQKIQLTSTAQRYAIGTFRGTFTLR